MRFFSILLFVFTCSLANGQTIGADEIIDSLEGIRDHSSDVQTQLNFYREAFEEYKLSQFEVAFWLASEGLDNTAKSDLDNRAFFSEAMGYSYQKLFVMDSALSFYIKALELYKELDSRSESARVMDAIARIHRKLQNHQDALWYYTQAFDIYDDLDDDEGRARILNESGAVYEYMGETQKALESYESSLQIQLRRNDSVGIGYSLEFIGYNYMSQDSLEVGERYLLKALEYRQGMDDDFALMLNEYALGELYNKKREFDKSDLHLERCFKLSEELSFLDIQQYVLDVQIENRKAEGEFERALLLMEQKSQLSDSLAHVANQARVDELSEKYQAVDRENQILVQKSEIQKQNYWIYGLTISSILLLLIGFLVYKQQELKQIKLKQEADLKLALGTIENQRRLDQLRKEISRELHDNIGTQLTFVISSIDSIKFMLSTGKDKEVDSRLERISSFTRKTIRELRDTIWAMNSGDIHLDELRDRVYNFVNQAGESSNQIVFEFTSQTDGESDFQLDSKTGMGVFRIIQEAVNNAMKHSNASLVTVNLSVESESVIVQVKDDGNGISESARSGNGMNNMKQRAAEVGGQLSIKSDNNGTIIELTFPKK